jgi:hypothetical protein
MFGDSQKSTKMSQENLPMRRINETKQEADTQEKAFL